MADTNTRNQSMKRKSVAGKFRLILFLFYLGSVLVAAPIVYWLTERQVYEQSNQELSMLVDMVQSIQSYVAKDLRPFFIEKGMFHAPGFSGIVATALIADNFKKVQPDYYIKNSSDNPLNPKNTPQPFEAELLERFRGDGTLGAVTETGMLDGKTMLVAAAPKKSKKGCLKCHGDPMAVPEQIASQFGRDSGYNYKIGDVVGVSSVAVPLGDVRALALERSLVVIGMLTVLFAIIFVAINSMVKRSLLEPIVAISEIAQDISKGKTEQPLEVSRNDEIGDLTHSLELLRRSFVAAMKRLKAR